LQIIFDIFKIFYYITHKMINLLWIILLSYTYKYVQNKEITRRMALNPAKSLCFRGFCLRNQKTMENAMKKAYKKPVLIAKNNPTGSFAAGCPANDTRHGQSGCKQCERTA